jgi:hypothetical protein
MSTNLDPLVRGVVPSNERQLHLKKQENSLLRTVRAPKYHSWSADATFSRIAPVAEPEPHTMF